MNAAPSFAYRQPFANSRLDSVAAATLASSNYRPKPVFSMVPGSQGAQDRPPIEWLLGGDDRVVAVSGHEYWVIDPSSRKTIVNAGITEGWVAFSPDGKRYVVRLGATLVDRAIDWPASPDQREASVRALEDGGSIKAMKRIGDDLLVALSPPTGMGYGQGQRTTLLRKRLGSDTTAVWEKALDGASERVPVLDDGTIILPMLDGVHTVQASGQELPAIPWNPLPGLLSADSKGTLFGYEQQGSEPSLSVLSLGTKLTVSLSIGTPVQPPVLLRDGRVVAVSASKIVCLESLRPAWTHDVPEGNALVTGTQDGEILLRAGTSVKRISAHGLEVWTGDVGGYEPIRSNPFVATDGRLYVATATTIHCFFP